MIKSIKIIAVLAVAAVVAGCQTNPSQPMGYNSGYNNSPQVYNQGPVPTYNVTYNLGQVQSVNVVNIPQGNSTSGVGAVGGGVVGGLLGNQVGKGSGRAAMTVLGAVAGGVAGNSIESRGNVSYIPYYELIIRMHNGQMMRVLEPTQGNSFYQSQYVKVYQHPRTGQWHAVPSN